jgi:hypothetical protein
MGSPIKGRVKKKNTSPLQKIYFFRLALDGFAKSPNLETHIVANVKYSGLFTNPSISRNSTTLLYHRRRVAPAEGRTTTTNCNDKVKVKISTRFRA